MDIEGTGVWNNFFEGYTEGNTIRSYKRILKQYFYTIYKNKPDWREAITIKDRRKKSETEQELAKKYADIHFIEDRDYEADITKHFNYGGLSWTKSMLSRT